ncbi:MAG: hypothetical protein ACRCW0_09425 [Clostridium sp.]
MIKNKSNISELISKLKSFSYEKEEALIEVSLKSEETVHIRCYGENCIIINYYDLDKGISQLYKDRKYINKELFQ